jgi:anti-sigma B factor antagonist
LISAVVNSFNPGVFHVRAAHIDASNAQWLRSRLLTAIADGERQMVVDLAGVQSIDSSGISALLTARKALGGQGALTFVSLSEAVAKALRATGADQGFQVKRVQCAENEANTNNPESLFTASLSPASTH